MVCDHAAKEPVISGTANHCRVIPAQLELGHIQLHARLLTGLSEGCAQPVVGRNTARQSNRICNVQNRLKRVILQKEM